MKTIAPYLILFLCALLLWDLLFTFGEAGFHLAGVGIVIVAALAIAGLAVAAAIVPFLLPLLLPLPLIWYLVSRARRSRVVQQAAV